MLRRRRNRGVPVRHTRRRGSRWAPVAVFVFLCVGLAWFFEQQATTTIIFVRHAEPVAVAGDDPPLSRSGRQRAELLADVIRDIDVVEGVDAVYASEHRRTRETAAAVAERLELDVSVRDPYDVASFMAQVLRQHKGEIVLVVTLGDALAPLVEELHGSKNIPPFGREDHDDIYIVTIPWFGKVKTLRMHYGFFSPHDPKPTGYLTDSSNLL